MQKEQRLIEHASSGRNKNSISEEKKKVFLRGYYSLLDSEIKALKEKEITNDSNTPTDEQK